MERGSQDACGGGVSVGTAAPPPPPPPLMTPSYYERMDYSASSGYQESDRERGRDRSLRSERDNWRKAVDDFIDERRVVIRDRSPQRDRDRAGRDREWKDKRKDSRERDRERDKRSSGSGGREYSRSSPRDDDVGSNSSGGVGGGGRYNREDYQMDSDDDWDYQRKHDRWQEGDDEKSGSKYSGSSNRGNDGYRDDDRKWNEKGKENSRDGHGSSSRHRDSSRDDRKRDDYSKVWNNEDSYDSSETRDSGEYESSTRRSRSGDYSSSNDYDKITYKDQAPNRTIIIRGLAQHITESDIWQDTVKCNLVPKDIRLIRRKDTGTSRGFAFVEFLNTSEAVAWMEMKQGELMLKDHYRAVMQYSLQRLENDKEKWISDWHCKCSAHNFKRRYFCYKCGCTRQEGELMEGYEEVCPHPTYTVLLRGLDALTTEENVLQSIQSLSSLPIRSVEIGRDPVTNTSRGVCYLKMNSVVDAVYLHNALLMANPVIDGKQAVVSYCRLDQASSGNSNSSTAPSSLGSAAIAAAHWSHQKTSNSSQYTLDDVNRLAEYSANLYATNPQEKASYLTYYQQYYQEQISKGKQISLPSSASLSGAPTVAGANAQAEGKTVRTPLTEPPNGSGSETYPVPDVSTYQYDKSSGYYYDPYTTLYYDANSQYYYNQKTQTFLYWDAAKSTYLPAPTAGSTTDPNKQNSNDSAQKEEELKKAKEKEKQTEKDKVKVAKRIAKDMEKWAKTLNHKKEVARQNLISAAASQPSVKAQGAADIGFAVLERKDLPIPTGLNIGSNSNDGPAIGAGSDNSLVAAYGQGSDSEDDQDDGSGQHSDDKQFTDWSKLACLLCKRQFPSKDVLVKHQQLSDLHKQNLEQWYKSRGLDLAAAQQKTQQYRDRAKERRLKYGEPDQPQPNRFKEIYMKAREATVTYEEPTKMGLGSDNLGNKLLQKMGWQEGMGLGKKNQGRTSIIETERRSATAGLGTKSQGVVPGPGESYKDCVKKMMKIRYQEIEEKS